MNLRTTNFNYDIPTPSIEKWERSAYNCYKEVSRNLISALSALDYIYTLAKEDLIKKERVIKEVERIFKNL